MLSLKFLFGICLCVLIGIFFKCDCDFFLYFASFDEVHGFDGQVIWITGASSGIGAALAIDLTKAGAQVIISARRENMLETVAEDCKKVGRTPLVLPLDVTNPEDQQRAYDKIIEQFGRVDSLVLNAGKSQRAPALETPMSGTEELIKLNFLSYVSLTKVVLPGMIARGNGQLVLMSSLSGRMGTPLASSYSATKFALHGYYDALRAEISTSNVSVSIVCPGPVESEITLHTIRAPNMPTQSEGAKMSTARCTHLVAKGMYHKVDEMWISDQPFLAITYLHTYFPWVSRQIFKKVVGPSRIRALKSGENIYAMKSLLK